MFARECLLLVAQRTRLHQKLSSSIRRRRKSVLVRYLSARSTYDIRERKPTENRGKSSRRVTELSRCCRAIVSFRSEMWGSGPGCRFRSIRATRYARSSAALRKHSAHRHASPATGIGRRTSTCLHQQSPAGSQVKAAPQRAQAARGGWSTAARKATRPPRSRRSSSHRRP